MGKSTTKLKLDPYATFFGDKNITDEMQTVMTEIEKYDLDGKSGQVVRLPLKKLRTFKDHPFHVKDDEAMYELAASIRQEGVLYPGIARPEGDMFEVIAGHRRWRGSELAEAEDMPFIILDITHEQAVRIMLATNIQRPHISVSEKAFAFRLDMENAREEKESGRTDSWLAEKAGLGRSTIQRYIRLTYLSKSLLDMVDAGSIGTTPGEALSYLPVEEQEALVGFMSVHSITKVSNEQAAALKAASKSKEWSMQLLEQVFLIRKKNTSGSVTLPHKVIERYFPQSYSRKEMETVIVKLLEEWSEQNVKLQEDNYGE